MTAAAIEPLADLPEADRRRLAVRLGATVAGVSLLAVSAVFAWLVPDQSQVAEAGKALAALICAAPVVGRGTRALLDPNAPPSPDPLVAIAVLAAMAGGAFDTAVLVPAVLEAGRLFEERTSLGVMAALEGIRRLRAIHAQREVAGGEETVSVAQLSPGDAVIVRPGEILPADGRVLSGASTVDSAVVTGESRLDDVGPGASVFAGTRNIGGLIRVEVVASGSSSLLGRVIDTLAEVERARIPVLRLFDAASRDYLPLVLTIAATVLFFTGDLPRAIAVLVVSVPTALVLAGPAAMVAAMTAASRSGILLKSARFLERIGEVDTLLLDKTGTVTGGVQAVRAVIPVEGEEEEAVLAAAASCAFGSIHPVSRGVLAEAERRGLSIERPTTAHELPGLGVSAETAAGLVRLGRSSWISEAAGILGLRDAPDAGTVAWVARDAKLLGHVELYDPPREGARASVDAVRELGIERVFLLTGDRTPIAREMVESLGLDGFEAEVHPDRKLARVREEQAAGHVVMMVGDGINDALALAGADIGVAVGSGTGALGGVNEVALGGADVALLRPDLGALPQLVRLADRVRAVMTQNAILGVGGAIGAVALAAVGVLGPIAGAAVQSLGVVAVVVNSGRLLRALDQPPTPEAAPLTP
jgi:heavy metal translocating P-type ATPase